MPGTSEAARLTRLPTTVVLGFEVRLARGLRARSLGLAGLDREQVGTGLLIPRCSCVHTFGMRFELDLYFLDGRGRVIGARGAVPPRRIAFCGRANAVLELPARPGGEFPRPPA